jgi:hypothetical protein
MRTSSTQNHNSDQFHPEPSNSLHRSESLAAVVSVASESPAVTSPEGSRLSAQEVAVASVGLLFLLSVWYFVRQDLRRRKANAGEPQAVERGLSRAEKLTYHLPCTKCHYFKANMYLPCAVNPTTALKPEAVNCMDFRPRDGSEYTEATG